jgi:auxin responsive GH3 family protein
MTFVHVGLEFPLECGLSAASGTTIGLRQMLKDFPSSVLATTSSPAEVFATTDGTQATYCHLLCSLAQRERVTDLRANFLIHVVSGLQFLEKHWER